MLLGYMLQFSLTFEQLQAIHQARTKRTKELILTWHDGNSRERLYLSALSTSEFIGRWTERKSEYQLESVSGCG
jgi:hypothetical protein